MKELQIQKKKEVDRKATKGRKIRYVVHEKMQNFMNAGENLSLLEGRDQIVHNLFGKGANTPERKTEQKKSPAEPPQKSVVKLI